MFLFPIILILAPGTFAALYYMHITDRKTMPPLKLSALSLTFIFLCNLFPMFVTMLKQYGAGLTVLGAGSVWYSLQFSVKYMILSTVAAVLLPWVVGMLSMYKLKKEDKKPE